MVFTNCNFSNSNFSTPSGTSITTHQPSFTTPLTSFEGFKLSSNSPLKNIGKVEILAATDFYGGSRPNGAGYDIGAFEEGATVVVDPPIISLLLPKKKSNLVTYINN